MERVFLGTGLIGGSLAQAAAQRGDTVIAWNRTGAKARALEVYGVKAAQTVGEAVRGAGLIHLALTSDAAVDAVLAELLTNVAPDAFIVDHTTASPSGASERVSLCEQKNVRYVPAPVFMSPAGCLAASGVMVVGGPRAHFDTLRPALEPMTGSLFYAGEDGHRAAAFKLIGNAMLLAIYGGLADALTLARAQGLSGEDVLSLFEVFNPAVGLKGRGQNMARGTLTTSWALAMARKDLGLMVEAADGAGPLGVLPGLGTRMDALIAEGEGQRDVGVLARDAVDLDPSGE